MPFRDWPPVFGLRVQLRHSLFVPIQRQPLRVATTMFRSAAVFLVGPTMVRIRAMWCSAPVAVQSHDLMLADISAPSLRSVVFLCNTADMIALLLLLLLCKLLVPL